jgi:uncharacterized protein YciI
MIILLIGRSDGRVTKTQCSVADQGVCTGWAAAAVLRPWSRVGQRANLYYHRAFAASWKRRRSSANRGRISGVMPMLFMIAGYLKLGAEEQLVNYHNEFNEHLSQSILTAAGVLLDREKRRKGYLGFIEADSFEDAERFIHDGPYYQAGLFERVEVFEYQVEVGQIG